jgi:ribosome-associated heat shock protein Hsp15
LDAGEKALRLDKWLWYARFFKTRGLATKVIAGGRLRLDGEVMTKPHRAALVGQVLTFAQGSRVRVIKILALGSRRGPADEASLLYEDLAPPEPKKADDAQKERHFEERLRGSGRPTKRERRQTDKLKPGR